MFGESACILSKLLELHLGAGSLGALEHTEPYCLALGPALTHGDDVIYCMPLKQGTGAWTCALFKAIVVET